MNWLMIIEREMNVNTLKSVYFIGAGGIGMSALVRYFLSKGKNVGGYDRTPSELTEKLIEEGAAIHYVTHQALWSYILLLFPKHIKSLPISVKMDSRYKSVRKYWAC